jgi:hypothetical protein
MNEMSATDPVVVVPVQRGARAGARREVLSRHARLTKAGHPIFCAPSRDELSGRAPRRQTRGTDGKVIYSTREAAEAAARELESLGVPALRSYLCGRSRAGHFHLTTDTAARTTTHRAPIPQVTVSQPTIPQPREPGERLSA